MRAILLDPWRAAGLGTLIALVVLLWAASGIGGAIAAELALRALHVLAAMVWAGLIVFVNLVQLAALKAASDGERPAIVRHVVPRTARLFTGAAHVTLATGVLLLWPVGSGIVHRPMLVAAIVGGFTMWAIVQFKLRPAIARVTGAVPAGEAEKDRARSDFALFARINLVLVVPVTVAMLVAAHVAA